MEILLLVAVLAVGASGLYVVATFNTRARQNTAPLINKAATEISDKITAARSDMKRQLQEATTKLRQDTAQIKLERSSAQSQLLAELDKIRQLSDQINERQDQLSSDLRQLGHHVAQLGKPRATQLTEMAGTESATMSQETQTEGPQEVEPLVFAMLEAESHMAHDGWGLRPRLYALAEKTSIDAVDEELTDDLRDAPPDALIPIEQKPLDAGDPVEVLAGIHWPEEVAGCVLVTEFIALPPGAEEDAPRDSAAAEKWAADRPGARRARLAVGVSREGEYTCGLRIEGEDDVQVGPGLADDLVAALLGTF